MTTIQDKRLKPCPFCGEIPSIYICDDEGNIHDEEYATDPWSGLKFAICHEEVDDCPIATDKYQPLGRYLYDTIEEVISVWNYRTK